MIFIILICLSFFRFASAFVVVEWNGFIVGRSPDAPIPKMFTQVTVEYDAAGMEVVTETVVQVGTKKFKKFKKLYGQTSRKRLYGPKKETNSMFLSNNGSTPIISTWTWTARVHT